MTKRQAENVRRALCEKWDEARIVQGPSNWVNGEESWFVAIQLTAKVCDPNFLVLGAGSLMIAGGNAEEWEPNMLAGHTFEGWPTESRRYHQRLDELEEQIAEEDDE